MGERSKALIVVVGGLVLALAALMVPAEGNVDSLALAVAVVSTLLVTTVVLWIVLPRQRGDRGTATSGLVLGILGCLAVMPAFYFAAPYALGSGAVLCGRKARLTAPRRAKTAVVLGIVTVVVATVMNFLGLFDALPGWPPQGA